MMLIVASYSGLLWNFADPCGCQIYGTHLEVMKATFVASASAGPIVAALPAASTTVMKQLELVYRQLMLPDCTLWVLSVQSCQARELFLHTSSSMA